MGHRFRCKLRLYLIRVLKPPTVDERYALSEAIPAYKRPGAGKGGKIVLVMASDREDIAEVAADAKNNKI